MDNDLKIAYENIMQAVRSEDVFGMPAKEGADTLEAIKKIYRRLSMVVHPDRHNNDPDAREMAEEAFKKLNEFYQKAEDKIEKGVYGANAGKDESTRKSGFVVKTRKREYHITSTIAQGDIATIYGGECIGGDDFSGKVAVKVAEDPVDNDLMQNEVRVLRLFQSEPGKQSKHLPVLLDQFKTNENQLGTILRYLDAYDWYSIREKYPNGVPVEHAAWILLRLLSVLGYAHSKGVIHGNIEPAHLMISPKDHNLFLIDWSYAAQTGEGFKVLNEIYGPPEAKERQMPIPASDLYSVGKCMIYLLGGDVKKNTMPYSVDQRFQRFIQFLDRESVLQRAQDAWEMYEKFMELRTEIWGHPRFIEFSM